MNERAARIENWLENLRINSKLARNNSSQLFIQRLWATSQDRLDVSYFWEKNNVNSWFYLVVSQLDNSNKSSRPKRGCKLFLQIMEEMKTSLVWDSPEECIIQDLQEEQYDKALHLIKVQLQKRTNAPQFTDFSNVKRFFNVFTSCELQCSSTFK